MAEVVARDGLAAQRLLSDAGELVDVALVLPTAAHSSGHIVDRLGDALRRQAHRIAGASRTVGAHAVAERAASLELAAQRESDGAELERLARKLRQTAAP